MRVRFGECMLDSETRELSVSGKTVHLTPKAFELLEILIESRPRAISKSEIHERLWRDTFVSDGTLTSLLAEVRSAIGDDAHESQFVRTVHRFGYAFSGEAGEERMPSPKKGGAPRFAYRLFVASREVALEDGESILGRDPDVTVFLDHTSVSRRHARIRVSGDQVVIEDLGSKNGVTVRGVKIDSPTHLADGEKFRIGSVAMSLGIFPLSGSTATAAEE